MVVYQFYICYNKSLFVEMRTQADFAELLEKSQELNLKYKTRIIELENQLTHQTNKAKEYENKFRDAVLQSEFSEGQELIQKLNSKEKELIECRKQIIDLNRSTPTQTDLLALARENEELMDSIEQIKSAAVSAIMLKEEEIEELNKSISHYELVQSELKFQYEKYESLERAYELQLKEKDQIIEEITEKLSRERQEFLGKLMMVQKEASQEEFFKQRLLDKANDLQGTIEKNEGIIDEYQFKIGELQNQLSRVTLTYNQEKAKLQIEAEELKGQIKVYQRDEKTLAKLIEQYKVKQKNAQEKEQRLTDKIEELNHKLSIKKKKQNKAIKDKITSSFVAVTKQNPVYASFAFRGRKSLEEDQIVPKHLGDFPELEEVDGIIENLNLDELGGTKEEQVKETPKEVPISQLMAKKKSADVGQVSKNDQPPHSPPQPISAPNPQITKEIQSYKQSIMRLQTQKKELQLNLNNSYNELQQLNQTINNLTEQLQQQRKNIAELRQQLKKTKKESQLIVQVQSLNLHVEKLELDMVGTKLKYAQQAEHQRQKYNRQKVIWTQKLVQLTEQLAKQDVQIQEQNKSEKKKKKGFFG